MNDVLQLCEKHGLIVNSIAMDRGVLVLNVSQIPTIDVLDLVSDLLRDQGYRFVSIDFSENA